MKKNASIDCWNNNINKSEDFILNNINEAIDLLNKLDGKKRTQLVIHQEENRLMIGGGPQTFIVSFVIGVDQESYDLVVSIPNIIVEETELVVGGQAGLFSNKNCVDYDLTLKAMTYYIENDQMDPNLVWEQVF